MKMDTKINFHFFEQLANIAREQTIPYFRQTLSVENKQKDGFDPVTIADRETEKALRDFIAKKRPRDSIYGEELQNQLGESDVVFVIDPIDGTRAFIAGLPVWGCLVGVTKAGKSIAGMMAQPYTQELYYSCGEGAYLYSAYADKQQKLQVSTCDNLENAILFSTAPHLFEGKDKDRFENLSQVVKMIRFGADCYAFAMLASGFVDIVVEAGLKPHDIMALIPIIEQAGGVISQWDGGIAENAGNIIAAATPELHAAALKLLQA